MARTEPAAATSPPSSGVLGVDALGTAASSARTRNSAPHRINASTVSRLLATLAPARTVEHVAETGVTGSPSG